MTVSDNLTNVIRKQIDESERLLKANVTNVAVNHAFGALEIALRNVNNDGRSSLAELIYEFARRGLVERSLADNLAIMSDIRNRAVHTDERISRQQARAVLDFVEEVVKSLKMNGQIA